MAIDPNTIPYPVYGTQGGGLVKWSVQDQAYIFIEAPDVPNLEVGDIMPTDWSITPANVSCGCGCGIKYEIEEEEEDE